MSSESIAIDEKGKSAEADTTSSKFPFKYTPAVPEDAAAEAYSAYLMSNCAYGAFSGVIRTIIKAGQDPDLASFPIELSSYGRGGLAGNRSLCGAINGGSMAIAMFHGTADGSAETSKTRDALIKELTEWCQHELLPRFKPEPALIESEGGINFDPPQTIAESLLCEKSCKVWENATGCNRDSAERKERCARLTADIAGKVVELLNRQVRSYLEK